MTGVMRMALRLGAALWLSAAPLAAAEIDSAAPLASEVRTLFKRLNYSGLAALLREDTALEIWPRQRRWVLRRWRRLAADRRVVLEDGGSGSCESLATFVYDELTARLPEGLRIEMHQAQEMSYFPPPHNQHVILLVFAQERPDAPYVLDPSFKRYQAFADVDDYLIGRRLRPDLFKLPLETDRIGKIGGPLPLAVSGGYLGQVTVEPVDGKLEEGHFALTVSVKRRHALQAFPAARIGRRGGRPLFWEDAPRRRRAFDDAVWEKLRPRLEKYAAEAVFSAPAPRLAPDR